MPNYRTIVAQRQSRNQSRNRRRSDKKSLVVAWTLLSSYFMSRGSDPGVSSRGRTIYYMANGLSNLYVLHLLDSANFSL